MRRKYRNKWEEIKPEWNEVVHKLEIEIPHKRIVCKVKRPKNVKNTTSLTSYLRKFIGFTAIERGLRHDASVLQLSEYICS